MSFITRRKIPETGSDTEYYVRCSVVEPGDTIYHGLFQLVTLGYGADERLSTIVYEPVGNVRKEKIGP